MIVSESPAGLTIRMQLQQVKYPGLPTSPKPSAIAIQDVFIASDAEDEVIPPTPSDVRPHGNLCSLHPILHSKRCSCTSTAAIGNGPQHLGAGRRVPEEDGAVGRGEPDASTKGFQERAD